MLTQYPGSESWVQVKVTRVLVQTPITKKLWPRDLISSDLTFDLQIEKVIRTASQMVGWILKVEDAMS